jgi:phosphoribosylpyrophosphate synthetase
MKLLVPGTANPPCLRRPIAQHLRCAFHEAIVAALWPTWGVRFEIQENVRGGPMRSMFVIQSTSFPPRTDKLMELLIMIPDAFAARLGQTHNRRDPLFRYSRRTESPVRARPFGKTGRNLIHRGGSGPARC